MPATNRGVLDRRRLLAVGGAVAALLVADWLAGAWPAPMQRGEYPFTLESPPATRRPTGWCCGRGWRLNRCQRMRDAGLWPGDVIVAMDDARIDTVEDLFAELRQRKPDFQVRLTIVRDGRQQQATVTLGRAAQLSRAQYQPLACQKALARSAVP
jgi:hypothetical protein